MSFKPFFRRFHNSAELWTGIYNGVRMISGIILLPLLLHRLSPADFGMYCVFVQIVQFVPVVDFGFSVAIGRFVSYAMGGAVDLQAQGVASNAGASAPNYQLLWQLLVTTRRLYAWLALIALVVVGLFGSVWVGICFRETAHPQLTWLAWGLVLLSVVLEIYFSWWNTFINGMNEVLFNARIGALMNVLKLILAAALLIGGLGLLALPLATLVSSTLLRFMARGRCLDLLGKHPKPKVIETKALLSRLWPNSWRLGTLFLGASACNAVLSFFCTAIFGLKANGMLGLALTIIGMIKTLSLVWTQVKWPVIGQHLIRQNYSLIRRTLRLPFLMQFLTLALLAAVALPTAPICVAWISSSKHLLPMELMVVLAFNCLMDVHFTFWTTLLSMQNRLPFLWSTLITNACTLIVALLLFAFTSLEMGALVIAPLLAGVVFNYWYWGIVGAANLGTTWRRFVFGTEAAVPKTACQPS